MDTDLVGKVRLETLLDSIEKLAESQDATIYNICRRRVGWAIQWFDETRCTTPVPDPEKHWKCGGDGIEALATQMRYEREAMQTRMNEGLVLYKHYPTFRECLEGEYQRLKEKESENKSETTMGPR
jgi:hypothetical protein